MGWLIKKNPNNELQEALKVSFEHVKHDVKNLQAWVHHLNQQNSYQQHVIDQLRGQIAHLNAQKEHAFKLTRNEIRELIDSHYSLEPIVERMKKLEANLAEQNRQPLTLPEQKQDLSPLMEKLAEINSKIHRIEHERAPQHHIQAPQPIAPQISHLKQRVVREVARRSKDYVKGVIFNFIQKYGHASGLQLREIVVEEQKLVSKSSFYRLLQELEDDGKIAVEQRGKEKFYTPLAHTVETLK